MEKLETVDGETLMSRPLQPLDFVMDTLISQGLHILAGSPKVGKSWLALWLAVTVAKGEPVWGLPVKKGTTLYLCLEDSQLRIQNRLFDVTEDAPPSVHFCTQSRVLGDRVIFLISELLRGSPGFIGTPTELAQRIDPDGHAGAGNIVPVDPPPHDDCVRPCRPFVGSAKQGIAETPRQGEKPRRKNASMGSPQSRPLALWGEEEGMERAKLSP